MTNKLEVNELKNNHNAIVKYAKSQDIMQRFADIMGDKNARAYVSSVLIAVGQSPDLQECTPQSIVVSAMRAATLKLSCDPATKQAHIVPFGKKGSKNRRAQFIIGYKGIYDMAVRTGKYRYINDMPIYEGEIVTEDRMTGMHSLSGMRSGDGVIGYFLYFEMLNGFKKTFYMTHEEMLAHAMEYSPSWDAFKSKFYPGSAWADEFVKMGCKTVIRLGLGRYGYFDPYDVAAITLEPSEENDTLIAELESEMPTVEDVTEGVYESESTEEKLIESLGFEKEEPVHDTMWALQMCLPDGRALGFVDVEELKRLTGEGDMAEAITIAINYKQMGGKQ